MVEVKSYGSKVQVWRGHAKQTKAGLKKKDIVRIKVATKVNCRKKMVWRYKSKLQKSKGKQKNSKSQRARSKWTAALKKARKDLVKKYPKSKGKLILVLKPSKKYPKLNIPKQQITMGKYLYKQAKSYY